MGDDSEILEQSGGKGAGDQAEASALFELLEHAAAVGVLPGSGLKRVDYDFSYSSLDDPLVRYAAQSRIANGVSFRRVSSEYGFTQETQIFPAAAVDMSSVDYAGCEKKLSAYSSSSGYAAGTDIRDALLHGINEVIERDATGNALIESCIHKRSFDSYSVVGDSYLDEQKKLIEKALCDHIYLTEIESIGGRTVAAFSERPYLGKRLVGFGTSLNIMYAAERALEEIIQEMSANEKGETVVDDGGNPDFKVLNRFPNLLHAANLDHPFLIHKTSEKDFSSGTSDYSRTDNNLIRQIEEAGYKVYGRIVWKDVYSSALVVQVMIPGAERFNQIKFGYPIEPTGRLRTQEILKFFRHRSENSAD
ncbi:YcaO-like family protein [Corynebacterium casei]|uniref:YcaO-like family protein n=1 Tax=Corynebacterium casei TaxID=160386 RepID=UPI003F9B9FC2